MLKWAIIIWIWQPVVNALFWQFFLFFSSQVLFGFPYPFRVAKYFISQRKFCNFFFEVAAFTIFKRVTLRAYEKFAQFVIVSLPVKTAQKTNFFQLSSLKYKLPKLIFMIVQKILRHIKTIFLILHGFLYSHHLSCRHCREKFYVNHIIAYPSWWHFLE